MKPRTIETGVRAVAVALVTAVGLFASTPNVHGKADTRGGIMCDVNKVVNTLCGDTGYSGTCLYTYKTCSSTSGWRFMTCIKKPLTTNDCEKDHARCFPRDDYATSGNCTPNYLPPSATRVSQAQ